MRLRSLVTVLLLLPAPARAECSAAWGDSLRGWLADVGAALTGANRNTYPGGGGSVVTGEPWAVHDGAYFSLGTLVNADCRRSRESPAEIHEPGAILYVNGVETSPERMCETLRYIRRLTGRPVVGIYNASRSTTLDLAEAANDVMVGTSSILMLGLVSPSAPPTPAELMLSLWIASRRIEGLPVEIWAHSQGGAITSRALFRSDHFLRLRRGAGIDDAVRVVSFGAATLVWPNGPRYEHWIHRRDPVPRYAGLGSIGVFSWGGSDAVVRRFGFLGPIKPRAHGVDAYLREWNRVHGRPF